MLNKLKILIAVFTIAVVAPAFAEDAADVAPAEEIAEVEEVAAEIETPVDETVVEGASVDTENFDADGSVFLKITNLEQEKVLMKLEKERAQLELELDRIASEKKKLAGASEAAAAKPENDEMKAEIEELRKSMEEQKAEFQKQLETTKKELEAAKSSAAAAPVSLNPETGDVVISAADAPADISELYRLVDIVGAGSELQATIENLSNGQRKKIAVGKKVDGLTVKSISVDDGITFELDGNTYSLGIASSAK
jgi:type IV pilus biogenesis protein PilP